MERQHLSQTKNAIAPPQSQTNAIARSSAHLIEELQGAIGNRAVNQLLVNQPIVQAKPMFRGLSQEFRSNLTQIDQPIQAKEADSASVKETHAENKTGLPDNLKVGIENLSGIVMDDVRVHYNSSKPSQLQALAYTQGTDIHVAPGQETHLPHEAWHVVQQAQGRVKPTIQAKGVEINDDRGLEKEADEWGKKAIFSSQVKQGVKTLGSPETPIYSSNSTIQLFQGQYALYIPKKRFQKELRGVDVKNWIVSGYGQQTYEQLKNRYNLAFKDGELYVIGVDNLGKLELLLNQLGLYRKLHIDKKVDDSNPQEESQEAAMSEKETLAASNIQMMTEINKFGRIRYPYNVKQEELQELSQRLIASGLTGQLADASTGYANPKYLKKTGNFTWVLRKGVRASVAIRDFLNLEGTSQTVAECGNAIQAVNYYTILQAVGDKAFDLEFSKEDERLTLQLNYSGNPLTRYFEDEAATLDEEESAALKQKDDELISAPNYRPAKQGGWYYIQNHEMYKTRHCQGFLGGENAFYYGKEGGQQKFGGLGLSDLTEKDIVQTLVDAFNQPPSAAEVENIYKRGFDLKYPGLMLPKLGNIESINEMPLNTQIINFIQKRYRQLFPGGMQIKVNRRSVLLMARMLLQEQMKKAKLIQPLKIFDLLQEIGTKRIQNEAEFAIEAEEIPAYKNPYGKWEKKEDKIILDRSEVEPKFKKITLRTATDLYCEKFGFILNGWIMQQIKDLNSPTFQKGEGVLVECRKKVIYPLAEDMIKFYKMSGGFTSSGAKVLSFEKIKDLRDSGIEAELHSLNLQIKETVTNGNCMYDAIRHQLKLVEGIDLSVEDLRKRMAYFILANSDHFAPFVGGGIEQLIRQVLASRSWNNQGGDVAAEMIATLLKREVIVITPNGITRRRPNTALIVPTSARIQSNNKPLTVVYNGIDHYYSTKARP